jgi:hypothetical protein
MTGFGNPNSGSSATPYIIALNYGEYRDGGFVSLTLPSYEESHRNVAKPAIVSFGTTLERGRVDALPLALTDALPYGQADAQADAQADETRKPYHRHGEQVLLILSGGGALRLKSKRRLAIPPAPVEGREELRSSSPGQRLGPTRLLRVDPRYLFLRLFFLIFETRKDDFFLTFLVPVSLHQEQGAGTR